MLKKGGAEIISIDAFNKSEENNEFVIGITIIKVYLNNLFRRKCVKNYYFFYRIAVI